MQHNCQHNEDAGVTCNPTRKAYYCRQDKYRLHTEPIQIVMVQDRIPMLVPQVYMAKTDLFKWKSSLYSPFLKKMLTIRKYMVNA